MATIATRRLDRNTYSKAETFLRKVEQPVADNMYHYMVKGCADDGLVLDALLHLQGNKISIKTIWALEHDQKDGMLVTRSFHGERGSYAKILGEKYFNRFLEHLDTVDIDDPGERWFMLTADLIKEIETEIDQGVNPERLTYTEINAYDRVEMWESGKSALRWFCHQLGEDDYVVTYHRDAQIFETVLCSRGLNIEVPLADVVRRKWETGYEFARALLSCTGDLVVSA